MNPISSDTHIAMSTQRFCPRSPCLVTAEAPATTTPGPVRAVLFSPSRLTHPSSGAGPSPALPAALGQVFCPICHCSLLYGAFENQTDKITNKKPQR